MDKDILRKSAMFAAGNLNEELMEYEQYDTTVESQGFLTEAFNFTSIFCC